MEDLPFYLSQFFSPWLASTSRIPQNISHKTLRCTPAVLNTDTGLGWREIQEKSQISGWVMGTVQLVLNWLMLPWDNSAEWSSGPLDDVKMPHVCMLSHFRHVQLFVTPWTGACQAPLSMEFCRQEYSSGLLYPPGIFLTQRLNTLLLNLLHCRQILYPLSHLGSPKMPSSFVTSIVEVLRFLLQAEN